MTRGTTGSRPDEALGPPATGGGERRLSGAADALERPVDVAADDAASASARSYSSERPMRSRRLTRSLRRSQPSAASPSVVTHLVIGRTKGTLREGPHALVVPEESLDHAILEGVIGDDDDAAAGSEETHRLRQGGSELLELPVGRDAERLEGTTRR